MQQVPVAEQPPCKTDDTCQNDTFCDKATGKCLPYGPPGKDHSDAQEDEVRTHSASDMAYMGGNWRVGPDQALRITIHPARGGARYWGFTLVNPWMESYEYRQRHVCTNDQLAARNADGSWTIVIAHRDPGVPNWLDSEGRPFGMVFWRFFLPEGEIETPQAKVVPFAEIARR